MFQSIALLGRKKGFWEPEKVVFHGRYCLTGGKAHSHWDYKKPFLIPWQRFQLKYFMVWPECCGVHAVRGLGYWGFFPFNKIFPWKHTLLVNQKKKTVLHAESPCYQTSTHCYIWVFTHGLLPTGIYLWGKYGQEIFWFKCSSFFFLLLDHEDFFHWYQPWLQIKKPCGQLCTCKTEYWSNFDGISC